MSSKTYKNYQDQKAHRVRYSKTLELGNGQRIELNGNSTHGYFTTVSRDVMRDSPIVIGPLDLTKEQWLELAKQCAKIAELLEGRSYPNKSRSWIDPELY